MNKDYIKAFEGAERRFAVNEMKVEKRAEGDAESFVVEGYAALFNAPTEISGWFREEILPGAFDDVLTDDVRALFNHDPNQILARTTSKTLEIGVDEKGLWYRFTIPERSFAKDLADAIASGDVSQSSFAFRAKETNWVYIKDELETRQIVKVERLYDVSPVTYPAYADTTVAQRSHDAYMNEIQVRDAKNGNDKELSLIDAQILINENQL
jgi:HK97 family phage prohead protease